MEIEDNTNKKSGNLKAEAYKELKKIAKEQKKQFFEVTEKYINL